MLPLLWAATAHAQDPQQAPSALQPAELAPEAAVEAAAPQDVESATNQTVGHIEIDGVLIDPKEKLEAFVRAWSPDNAAFVVSGDYDAVGTPVGTVPRLSKAFDTIGYQSTIKTFSEGGRRLGLRITLRPYDRLRYVFVKGNWPMRQDEIIRRLSTRPGLPVPPEGPLRSAWLGEEIERIETFLKQQGYLDATVSIQLDARPQVPAAIHLTIHIKLGHDYPVGPITVDGPELIPHEEVDDLFRHYKWYLLWLQESPFSRLQLRLDTAKLVERYRGLGYPAARVRPEFDPEAAAAAGKEHVPLRLLVEPYKHVQVAFEGNDCCADSELREHLTFFKQGVYDDYEIQQSREALALFYRQRGNMLVKVNVQRERISPENDRVVYLIEEGPRIRVKAVTFMGNRELSEARLAEVVGVQPFPWFGVLGLGGGGYASLPQLENDALRLRDHYKSSGFGPTTVQVDIAPQPDDFRPLEDLSGERDLQTWQNTEEIYVRFTIDEGPKLTVSKVDFRPAKGETLPWPQSFLAKSILTRVGQSYLPTRLDSDGRALERLLRDHGFPYGDTAHEVIENGHDREIIWYISTGPQVKVGPVFLRGNFLTRKNTILDWVSARPGDLLTTTAIERGQRNLAILQYFTNASPISLPGLEAGLHTVPVLIQVQERHDHFGIIRLGVGGSTDQRAPDATFPLGLYFSGGYDHGNLFGRGYFLRSLGRWGQNLRSVAADFEDPRLLSTLFRLQLSFNYLARKTERLGDTRVGTATVSLFRQLLPGFDAFVRYQLRDSSGTEFLVRGPGSDEAQQRARIRALVGAAGVGFEWLQFDNRLMPRQGFKLTGFAEVATPALSFGLGEDTFLKFQVQSLSVVPLSRRWSLHHTVRYAQGVPLDGSTLLPKVERFAAGGDVTLRGFQFERARTEVREYPLANGVTLVQFFPLGGNLRILSNLDLQMQISGPVYAGVFLDSGIVEDSLDAVRPRRFRHGAGISPLVVKLPVGDVSVAWGWPLDPGPGDGRLGRFHFNVGLMF